MTGVKRVIVFALVVFIVSLGYYVYAYSVYPPTPENETFWTELGEGFGELGLYGLIFIYSRTLLKIILGKGAIAHRLLPDYSPQVSIPVFNAVLGFLNRTHVYFGIATVAIILLHIGMMGIPMKILFFPAVLALVIWQAIFGLFLSWRYSPVQLKKFSYLVHAQFVTGIMIGIFAFFGHMLIDD
ncbi:MAG: hypothetical protein PVF28_01380 [Thioalkalispiraceae bacterium]|jgi:hypothetical protein